MEPATAPVDANPPTQEYRPEKEDSVMNKPSGDREANEAPPSHPDSHLGGPISENPDYPQSSDYPPNPEYAQNPDYPPNPDYTHGSENGASVSGGKHESTREKHAHKPNKIYIGGLPEHTRQEDLQHCFGKLGNILNIELKVGYGFVEFDTRQAADEAISKYDEGFFMGNKIRVEASHGGGRTAKFSSDPGACFRCGNVGHWARECPNQSNGSNGHSRRDPPPPRDHGPPPARDYRDDRYAPHDRYRYDYPPPGRDMRRPPSPPRDYRDYPGAPPPRRDYDDYRRGPPPPPAGTAHRYDSRSGYYPPDGDLPPAGYQSRGYGGPPPPGSRGGYGPPPVPRDAYDRYDRRPPPPPQGDRQSYMPAGGRPRSPPMNGPPRGRDDYDRAPLPPRDYPPAPEYRGRPPSPRYNDYARSAGTPDTRYRRRSASPRSVSAAAPPYDPNYSSNGYPPGGNGIPNPSMRPPPGSRDYPPPRGNDAGYRRS